MHIRCPHCQNPIEIVEEAVLRDLTCPSCGSTFNLLPDETITRHHDAIHALGRFKLLERVGIGAFGEVWTARDTELDRTVAIKLPRKGQLDAEEAEQFLREARSAAQLNHPSIVSVHEVGKHEDQLFIVSDYVEGVTLAEWLTARRPTPHEAARLCAQLADAVEHAHRQGVIHRDLKPANIILDEDDHPHIMDFGLAKRDAGEITMTMEGKVLGTPAYMSPEQARGAAHHADRRSDIYSLGVILFEMLTGERPFRGSARMLLHQVIHDEAPSPRRLSSGIPRDLETICLKCLQKDPGKRYASASELAGDLRRFLDHKPIMARPVSRPERVLRWTRRHPSAATLLCLCLFLAVSGPVVAISQYLLRRDLQRSNSQLSQTNADLEAAEATQRRMQVDALYSSDIEALPSILKSLHSSFEQVEPLLSKRAASADLAPQERLRTQLALVDRDENHIEPIVTAMLQGSIAEVTLIRDVLHPYSEPVSASLWELCTTSETPPSQLLRAACTLATLAPADNRWNDIALPVARGLTEQPSLELPAWIRAFAPVRHKLIPHLLTIAQNLQNEESASGQDVTEIIMKLAEDSPETLAEVYLGSPPDVLPTLLPLLDEQRDKITPLLYEELSSQLVASWQDPPLDSRWSIPNDELSRMFENRHGVLAERFAFCLTMPVEEFRGILPQLSAAGYRPELVRPFFDGVALRVAALWKRDGADVRWSEGISPERLSTLEAEQQSEGYFPIDIAAYTFGDRCYSVLFQKRATGDPKTRIFADVASDKLSERITQLRREGYYPYRMHQYRGWPQATFCGIVIDSRLSRRTRWAINCQYHPRVFQSDYIGEEIADISIGSQAIPDNRREQRVRHSFNTGERMLAEDPSNDQALFYRAWGRFYLHQFDAALIDLNQLISAYPHNSLYPVYRAECLAHLGARQAARDELERLKSLQDDPGVIAYTEAILLALSGDDEAADRLLQNALEELIPDKSDMFNIACAYGQIAGIVVQRNPEKLDFYAERATVAVRHALASVYPVTEIAADPDFIPVQAKLKVHNLLKSSTEIQYCGIWHYDPRYETQYVIGEDAVPQHAKAKTLIGEGFRPLSLCYAEPTAGSLHDYTRYDAWQMRPAPGATVWIRPLPLAADQERHASRRARASALLSRWGDWTSTTELLVHTAQPSVRSYLVDWLPRVAADLQEIVTLLDKSPDISLRRALLTAIGNWPQALENVSLKQSLGETLARALHDATDPGLCNSATWLIHRANLDMSLAPQSPLLDENEQLREMVPKADGLAWYRSREGHTMVAIPAPGQFSVGSVPTDVERAIDEPHADVQLRHGFAIGSHEVTSEQFQRFVSEYPEYRTRYEQRLNPDPEGPAVMVSWYAAAGYCNWLNRQEGIPLDQWCYRPNPDGKYADGMAIVENHLWRNGYRLPTAAEWEYACRAGAATSRFYGQGDALLGTFAWYSGNSQQRAHEVGQLAPNDFGLFDILGNAWEWCDNQYMAVGDKPGPELLVRDGTQRELRGGSWGNDSRMIRAAERQPAFPGATFATYGFRVARTCSIPEDVPPPDASLDTWLTGNRVPPESPAAGSEPDSEKPVSPAADGAIPDDAFSELLKTFTKQQEDLDEEMAKKARKMLSEEKRREIDRQRVGTELVFRGLHSYLNALPAEQRAELAREQEGTRVAFEAKVMDLVQEHPASKPGFQAMSWYLREGRDATHVATVVDQLIEHHSNNAAVLQLCRGSMMRYTGQKQRLLRHLLGSDLEAVRATASYELAKMLIEEIEQIQLRDATKGSPPDPPAESAAAAEEDTPGIEAKLAEVKDLLAIAVRDGSRLPQSRGTVADLAKRDLFELEHLSIGCPIPDETFKDLDGVPLSLSEFRGQVIVLVFWSHFLDRTENLQTALRTMCNEYKDQPIVVLGVNQDSSKERLNAAIKEGKVTWKNWWDGSQRGPISTHWNIRHRTTVYVVDQNGLIRFKSADSYGWGHTAAAKVVARLLNASEGNTDKPGASD